MTKNAPHFNKIFGGVVAATSLFFLLPSYCQAAVFINEIAWMGDNDSANHEWIELYNDGAAQNVDGWTLTALKAIDGTEGLSIELSGTIPAQSWAVLERGPDESLSTVGFMAYRGALVNSGATLRLQDSAGNLIDQVAGGEDWSAIGGNNDNKDTAQYTAGGWISAAATPGTANHTQPTTVQTDPENNDSQVTKTQSTNTSNSSSRSKKSSKTVRLSQPEADLALTIDAQSIGYVNQNIKLRAKASGVSKYIDRSLHYQWNLGDGSVGRDQKVTHRFAYPGTYVVTLHAKFKQQQQVARHEITILPVKLSLSTNPAGDVQLNNDSPYEVDISGYTIRGHKTFTFPDYSIILPNQTITLPRHKVSDQKPAVLAVYDQQKIQLASLLPQTISGPAAIALASAAPAALLSSNQQQRTTSHLTPAVTSQPDSVVATAGEQTLKKTPVQTESKPTTATPTSQQLTTTVSQSNSTLPRNQRLAYVGLVMIILLAALAIYLTPRQKPGQ